MRLKCWGTLAAIACCGVFVAASAVGGSPGASGDSDGNGYVDLADYPAFRNCLAESGPGNVSTSPECIATFDADGDNDIDLADHAAFQRARGHLPIPLRDTSGSVLIIGSTVPYSGRQTCTIGGCHDVSQISNGAHFQQGRTDVNRNIILHDDFFADGRWWVRGSGMYGRWSGGGGGLNRQTAGKTNANESAMDLTAFNWAFDCGACHVGGGPAEFDRDGHRLFDEGSGKFGYELDGKEPDDVVLDGDYAFLDTTNGSLSPAPWNITGVSDPDCLHCHRADRTWIEGKDMHREWRANVLATIADLVDGEGDPVPAFAAANTAGQGWFSTLDTDAQPPVLQISYAAGVADSSLFRNPDDTLSILAGFLSRTPRDRACWGCHHPGGAEGKRGMLWFDERDVHFKKLTNRSDTDPYNNVPDDQAAACTKCHVGDVNHNVGKGNSPYLQFRNETDWQGLKSCRQCHLSELPNGSPNPDQDPEAPGVPGDYSISAHIIGFAEGTGGMMRILACQACHVPYPLQRAVIATDWSVTGTAVEYYTDQFLSADPLDPTNPDKSKWYPTFRPKVDSDGLVRYFPQKMEIAIYWADWDRKGTPQVMSDDTVQPIILWRLLQVTHGQPLPGITDDNDDDKPEINRPQEMLLYMQALKQNDSYGRPVASNPVLVKGPRVWYEDPQAPDGVNWFDSENSGVTVQPYEVFGLDHNVLLKTEAWGVGDLGCGDCHRPLTRDAPVIERLILLDPFGVDGRPVYKTIRELTGWNPP